MVLGLGIWALSACGLSIRWIKFLALCSSFVLMALAGFLYQHFDSTSSSLQFVEHHSWIPLLHIDYTLGVGGLSVLFILLTVFSQTLMVLSVWHIVRERAGQYMAIILFSTGILNGIFSAENAILYYFFWEASLLPLYLGVGIWGGKLRSAATLKFFLFNFLGSLFMLAGFIYFYLHSGTFNLTQWQQVSFSASVQNILFMAFFLAFAVKLSIWPLHTWFTDMLAEAPIGGGIILSLLMLKTGAYGLLRINFSFLPGVTDGLVATLIVLALISVLCMSYVALIQKDMRRLLAYSSVSHMGMVLLGFSMLIFILREPNMQVVSSHADAVLSLQGAIFQMITYAFTSAGLFILVAICAARFGSSLLHDYQGLAKTLPVLAVFFVIFALSNVGFPGTVGFVGEFFIVIAAMHAHFWVAALAALTLVLSPAYMLWWVKRVIFGEVTRTDLASMVLSLSGKEGPVGGRSGLRLTEWIILLALAIPTLYFGVSPHFILKLSESTSLHLIDLLMRSSYV